MTVFVRWYGKVLEGDMLDGEWMGMKQVRIPLDGHYPVALFTPQHVYESADHPDLMAFDTRSTRKESFEVKMSPPSDILPSHDRKVLELFKASNWDHERNHLRVDKLDEFYRLWREAMTPDGFVEADTSKKLSEEPSGEISKEHPNDIRTSKRSSKKPSKKMLRSTGRQQFSDATQLSLFD